MASARVGSPMSVVPGLDGELAGDQGRGALGAILEDLEQIVALGAR